MVPIALLFFISCSSDETDKGHDGIWDLTEINVTFPVDNNNDGIFSSNIMQELPCLSGTMELEGDLWSMRNWSGWVFRTTPEGEFIAWECFRTPGSSNSGTISRVDETSFYISSDLFLVSGNKMVITNGKPNPNTEGPDWTTAVLTRR